MNRMATSASGAPPPSSQLRPDAEFDPQSPFQASFRKDSFHNIPQRLIPQIGCPKLIPQRGKESIPTAASQPLHPNRCIPTAASQPLHPNRCTPASLPSAPKNASPDAKRDLASRDTDGGRLRQRRRVSPLCDLESGEHVLGRHRLCSAAVRCADFRQVVEVLCAHIRYVHPSEA